MESYRANKGLPAQPRWSPGAKYRGAVDEDVDSCIRAPVMFIRDGRPITMPGVDGTFPSQKVSLQTLPTKDKDTNPLMWDLGDDTIRYVHLPVNNMAWVEEAIARYYHEDRPEKDDLYISSKLLRSETKADMILKSEYWQSQRMFDDNTQVHARHMRPSCDTIVTNDMTSDNHPKNVVLFMPCLHWETDRGRMLSATKIKQISQEREHIATTVGRAMAAHQQDQHPDAASQTGNDYEVDDASTRRKLGGLAQRRKLIGHVLRAAAALLEAMDFDIEERLTMKYLNERSPLHPRRTLDQSYYGALKSTGTRDRDQVVHRATKPTLHDCAGHLEGEYGKCRVCQDNSKDVPRIIMVDQLWLWILDKNLALIVIDQCSRVFFERPKVGDLRPNMIAMFAEAIRGVTYKQTAAFDQFLVYSDLASRGQRRPSAFGRHRWDAAVTHNTLLIINPEGGLLKEAKDIIDEIHIILKIQSQQQMVMKAFVKHVKQILLGRCREGAKNRGPNDVAEKPEDPEEEPAQRTLRRAQDLLNDVEDRTKELVDLLDSAKTTSNALKDLLNLKQQQAGVIEAREAVKIASETKKQGQYIVMFTGITIILLPLSFTASLFGMNAVELNGGELTLSQELKYMLPTCLGIIIFSFVLAFSRSPAFMKLLFRASSLAYNTAITWLAIKTGLYVYEHKAHVTANSLREREIATTAAMKADYLSRKAKSEALRKMAKLPEGDEPDLAAPAVTTLLTRSSSAMALSSVGFMGRSREYAYGSDDVESGASTIADIHLRRLPNA
ncbi:hypothetical protein DL766_003209 [Monosporascus sp. MC13-8B]|uniref:Uncharacterized protein n=1 Tax=Monosporascus cannonballus TaxID=155416 RepID=A0ABY0H5J5_9PEZI|nr:hypothetical protein DL762_006716 [Monosporascus cannonballus]RYO92526.1 hypothetical protein DL763_004655 [Monosporascus cannonballus]RYP33937.1 hypothetical protein DL766_003209 [Monosporascus sp. MC13-8B]